MEVLICISPMVSDVEYLFLHLLVSCISFFLSNVYLDILCTFKLSYVCLFDFTIRFLKISYIFLVSVLVRCMYCKIFSHTIDCLFIVSLT